MLLKLNHKSGKLDLLPRHPGLKIIIEKQIEILLVDKFTLDREPFPKQKINSYESYESIKNYGHTNI